VVQEPGGQGLRKVQVELASEGADDQLVYTTATDTEGHFALEDIKPGHYVLSASRSGFMPLNAHHRKFASAISLQPSQEMKDMVLRMQPAGVIAGKVLDHDGDPMQDVMVSILRYSATPHLHPVQTGLGRSNDLGEYRVGGLGAGRYLVLAQDQKSFLRARIEGKKIINQPSGPLVSAPTYYPGTTDREQAVPLEVHPGEEMNANVTMVASKVFHIRGFFSLPAAANANARISPQTNESAPWQDFFPGWKIEKDGSFDIPSVLPGAYTFRVMFEAEALIMVRLGETIEVSNKDVDNVRLTPLANGHIRGQARMDSATNPDWSQVVVGLELDDEGDSDRMFVPSNFGKVTSTGSFEMKDVFPGSYHVSIHSSAPQLQDCFLKSVNLGGKDVSDTGFTISGGTYSLDLVLSANGGTLEGSVVDDKGNAAPDAEVVAIPASHSQRNDLFAHTTSDQNGRFRFRGLDPLEYTVLAFEDLGDDDYHDPEFVKPYADHAKKIQLNASDSKSIQLKVIPAAASEP
jgi:hypothetical protein